jgi:redox-sensitive bicupin YhaK (pirin superfamily)
MSNVETHPVESVCQSKGASGAVTERYESRVVPLGGIRGIQVHRLLPLRALPTVGAWCFLDKFGPQRADMRVLPHPHTGLQTVTWPLAGEVRHRDSLGHDVVIRPGQLNLMTSGPGISHSEFSLGANPLLDGLQLWVALPADTDAVPAFEQHTDLPTYSDGDLRAVVFMGELGEVASPATTYSRLVGAEVQVPAGAASSIPLRPAYEHAVLALDGTITVAGAELAPGPLMYLGIGRSDVRLTASTDARLVLLGGEPFTDDLVMWWNFVGRSHDEIAAARAEWEGPQSERFGVVEGHGGERVPAPVLPAVRLTPRRRQRSL